MATAEPPPYGERGTTASRARDQLRSFVRYMRTSPDSPLFEYRLNSGRMARGLPPVPPADVERFRRRLQRTTGRRTR